MSNTLFHPADARGHIDHGWLETWHSFSFASWYDPAKVHFGMLRVLNDDRVAPGMGFGTHPHDNMEIITIVIKGALAHQDSMGHIQAIYPDEVQVMTAGTGIMHSEYNHHPEEPVELFQIWIFPDERKVAPRYDQRTFDPQLRKDKLQILVSPIHNEDEGLKIHQNAWIYRATPASGKLISGKAHSPNSGFYIFVIEGSISAASQKLSRRDALGIWDADSFSFEALEDSDVLVLEVPMSTS